MHAFTYAERLKLLGLERLEERRIIAVCTNSCPALQSQICTKYQMPYLLFTLYHLIVATDKDPSKFRSIFSDNLQPIATHGKKARGTLLVDIGCSSKRAPPPLVIATKLAAAIYGGAVVSTR